MSIYLYIFIMTISTIFIVLAAVNTCLKSFDKLFDEIEKVKQIKVSNTNELSWKPSKEQLEALLNILHPDDPYYLDLKDLYEDLKKL